MTDTTPVAARNTCVQLRIATRVTSATALLSALIGIATLVSGCAPGKYTYYVEDGNFVASHYTYDETHPEGSVRRIWSAEDRYARRVRRHPPPRRHAPSQAELDAYIPQEFANIVSSRAPTHWASMRKMCADRRAGYCDKPNYAHCHGSYCHAHTGGNVKHTHASVPAMPLK